MIRIIEMYDSFPLRSMLLLLLSLVQHGRRRQYGQERILEITVMIVPKSSSRPLGALDISYIIERRWDGKKSDFLLCKNGTNYPSYHSTHFRVDRTDRETFTFSHRPFY